MIVISKYLQIAMKLEIPDDSNPKRKKEDIIGKAMFDSSMLNSRLFLQRKASQYKLKHSLL